MECALPGISYFLEQVRFRLSVYKSYSSAGAAFIELSPAGFDRKGKESCAGKNNIILKRVWMSNLCIQIDLFIIISPRQFAMHRIATTARPSCVYRGSALNSQGQHRSNIGRLVDASNFEAVSVTRCRATLSNSSTYVPHHVRQLDALGRLRGQPLPPVGDKT